MKCFNCKAKSWGIPVLLSAYFLVLANQAAVVSAQGPSFNPASLSINVECGDVEQTITESVQVSVEASTASAADVVFLCDNSGSMLSVINNVKTNAQSILDQVRAQFGDVQFGVASFGDNNPSQFQLEQAITADDVAVKNGINAWTASGGFEPWFYTLWYIAGGDLANTNPMGFRSNTAKIIVLIGDEPGNIFNNIYPQEALAQLKTANIRVLALNVGINGLNQYPVSGFSGAAAYIASETGGQYYQNIVPSDVSNAIVNGIAALPQEVSLVGDCGVQALEVTATATGTDVVPGGQAGTVVFDVNVVIPGGDITGEFECTLEVFINNGATGVTQTISVLETCHSPDCTMSGKNKKNEATPYDLNYICFCANGDNRKCETLCVEPQDAEYRVEVEKKAEWGQCKNN